MTNKTIKILLVDDHLIVRNGVRLMLAGAPEIEVAEEAGSAHEAMQMIRKQVFDVAVVDIGLPDRSGLELIKLLRAECPRLAVLVVSMYSEDIYAVRAFKNGASGYLTKNSPAPMLIDAIRKLASGSKYVSPDLSERLLGALGGNAAASHEALSDREFEVLKLIAAGESLVNIGEKLHVSASTVTTYRARILEKMNMKSNTEIARYAIENGLLN